jgi:hypothetical protein
VEQPGTAVCNMYILFGFVRRFWNAIMPGPWFLLWLSSCVCVKVLRSQCEG